MHSILLCYGNRSNVTGITRQARGNGAAPVLATRSYQLFAEEKHVSE